MEPPVGWSGIAGLVEPDWPPSLGRLDVRVENSDLGTTDHVWLLSDEMAETLAIRRQDDDKVSTTFRLPKSSVGWWNDAGSLAGVVVFVATATAAGIVGNAAYDVLKTVSRRIGRTTDEPPVIVAAAEAAAMARWITCAQFHDEACECPDSGRGLTASTGMYDPETDENYVVPSFGFTIRLESIEMRDESWTVTLSETEDGAPSASWEYEIAGVTGRTFFASARCKSVGPSRLDLPPTDGETSWVGEQ